ncbi:MAG: lysylphosphatidylglycerol synthase domain-containing protein [Bacteroidales bacterium]
MQKIFRILLYLSMVFFIWYLYRADYLVFDDIGFDAVKLSASLILLFAGFLAVSGSWGFALRIKGVPVRYKDALISQGIYIFSKYIPGKLWVILGRASWFSPDKTRLKTLSLISLQEQMVFLWWGLALSLPPTLFITGRPWIGLIIFTAIVLLTLILFSGWFHRNSSGLLGKLLKRDFDFNPMKWNFFLRISFPVLLFWLLWSAGFYFLMLSLHDNIPLLLSLSFPASMTYGFVVVFLPAGVGVREAILVSFLVAGGLTPGNAVTLSLISRFWFVAGEVFLFLVALLLKFSGNKGAGYPEYPST